MAITRGAGLLQPKSSSRLPIWVVNLRSWTLHQISVLWRFCNRFAKERIGIAYVFLNDLGEAQKVIPITDCQASSGAITITIARLRLLPVGTDYTIRKVTITINDNDWSAALVNISNFDIYTDIYRGIYGGNTVNGL